MYRPLFFTVLAVALLSAFLFFARNVSTPLTLHISSTLASLHGTEASKNTSPNVQQPPTTSPPAESRAYVTFLATRSDDPSAEDTYFTAVRVLNYQLQYAPATRTNLSIPFVVLVAPFVSAEKRATLTAEGAIVQQVELLKPETDDWLKPGETRFQDQFTKLRLFEQTQYSRILYLDADMLLLRSLDGIWDEPVARQAYSTLPADQSARPENAELDALLPSNYTIVGVSDTGGADHPFPPVPTSRLNGGFFLLQPSTTLFNYYKAVLNTPNLFDSGLMEQSLLNYAHAEDGRMPWHAFESGKWNVNWPRWRDALGGAATLHDKFWDAGNEGWIERKLVERWWRVQGQMEGYWQKHEAGGKKAR
jgi:alpha-N-acetylglucosamine transferase